jgi:hypothetical protein
MPAAGAHRLPGGQHTTSYTPRVSNALLARRWLHVSTFILAPDFAPQPGPCSPMVDCCCWRVIAVRRTRSFNVARHERGFPEPRTPRPPDRQHRTMPLAIGSCGAVPVAIVVAREDLDNGQIVTMLTNLLPNRLAAPRSSLLVPAQGSIQNAAARDRQLWCWPRAEDEASPDG